MRGTRSKPIRILIGSQCSRSHYRQCLCMLFGCRRCFRRLSANQSRRNKDHIVFGKQTLLRNNLAGCPGSFGTRNSCRRNSCPQLSRSSLTNRLRPCTGFGRTLLGEKTVLPQPRKIREATIVQTLVCSCINTCLFFLDRIEELGDLEGAVFCLQRTQVHNHSLAGDERGKVC